VRLENEQQSSNVEDRRGKSGGMGSMIGRLGGMGRLMAILPFIRPLLRSKTGWILLAVGAFIYFSTQGGGVARDSAKEDKQAVFISKVLKTTEDVWKKELPKYGYTYKEPKLVLFRGSTRSGCGYASAQSGPFYCPADQKIYLDLSFFDELAHQFGAKGDFAQAYVVAHEVGHHIQNLLGILPKVQRLQERALRTGNQKAVNKLQIPVELQADCLAGVWAHHIRQKLDPGDIEEGINAAAQIGDDMIQKRSQGYVIPDSFTHGTSKQRVSWFVRGYKSGDLRSCNTFK